MRSKTLIFFSKYFSIICIPLLIIIDQVVKSLVINFGFSYQINKGLAFGIFANNTSSIIISILGLFIIVLLFYRQKIHFPIILIVSGALANLLDRIIRGGVIDYINIGFGFPLFNIADLLINFGIIIYILYELKTDKS